MHYHDSNHDLTSIIDFSFLSYPIIPFDFILGGRPVFVIYRGLWIPRQTQTLDWRSFHLQARITL